MTSKYHVARMNDDVIWNKLLKLPHNISNNNVDVQIFGGITIDVNPKKKPPETQIGRAHV